MFTLRGKVFLFSDVVKKAAILKYCDQVIVIEGYERNQYLALRLRILDRSPYTRISIPFGTNTLQEEKRVFQKQVEQGETLRVEKRVFHKQVEQCETLRVEKRSVLPFQCFSLFHVLVKHSRLILKTVLSSQRGALHFAVVLSQNTRRNPTICVARKTR